MTDSELEAEILLAHANGDINALTLLYQTVAQRHEVVEETDQEAFFLTQAYIFALEAGHPNTADIGAKLRAMGRL